KDEVAEKALRREATLLSAIRPRVTMTVPDLTIYERPPVFSSHLLIQGEHLLTDQYRQLPEGDRNRLGEAMGRFYAELHGLDMDLMKAAGASPVGAWLGPETVRLRALPLLAPQLRDQAEAVIRAYAELPPDPHGSTYGFFDGHGWNMAFDHRSRR